ncbi:hypothetical protein DPX16_0591 [Anabarilius grahami]|uniref:Uncharacterized protein n=1 Tax=Anabarilius grahami TaxID=495550 RepID=A0A3N0XKK5_ANAGA|nr:hypothetical protein DPX16_0591 [Anabarilius grahami]
MSYEVRFWLTTSDKAGYPMPGFLHISSPWRTGRGPEHIKVSDIILAKLVISESSWSPEFIQELLPSAERTALLYHLSFLCLGGFPKLERKIRDQAIETQMLFGSSEAVLLKCAGTSSNLVTSLFPILIKAVEKNKPKLAVIYLEKARTWIKDIIRAVDDMVERCDPSPVHLKEVQRCLDQIRQILVDLNKFWKKVAVMLETLKDKTFVGEDLIKDLEDMKEAFLESIEDAKQDWKTFGECCQRAQNIFSIQSRTAYQFLEVNPSSLSKDEWNKQYESIMEKLRKINPEGSSRAAITE